MKSWKKTHRQRRGHLGPYQINPLTRDERLRKARKRQLRAEEGPKKRRARRIEENTRHIETMRSNGRRRYEARVAKLKARRKEAPAPSRKSSTR